MPVAMYDVCGSVAFVYWLRLKQFCSSHEGSVPFMAVTVWELFGLWGCLVVVFCSTLVSVCAMKGIPIGRRGSRNIRQGGPDRLPHGDISEFMSY